MKFDIGDNVMWVLVSLISTSALVLLILVGALS